MFRASHSRAVLTITVSLSAIFGLLPSAALAGDDPTRFPADRPADIRHIALNLRMDIPNEFAGGSATISLTALRELSSVRFDAVDFDVTGVTLSVGSADARTARFINDGKHIEVLFGDKPLPRGAEATIEIRYSVSHPTSGLHFFGPSEAEPDVPLVVWSQGESITNRYWIPCFDHPNEMQTTEMIVTVDAGNEAISNGRLVSRKENKDGTLTYHWLQEQPHVSYLVTLVVGEFYVERESWRGKPVVYYVPPEHKDDVKRSFGNTVAMLDFFSDYFGVEYPWDKYAQICAEQFGGGMENTSATTLGTGTLHDERAHLDFSSDGLVSHELGHQWFGDLITCKDWSHLWLNEGFATYSSALWSEHNLGQDEYDYQILRDMRRAIRGGKDRPIVDRAYENPGSMFDSRAYPKGSSVAHMLRNRVGEDLFKRSLKRFLTDNAHRSVETADLRKAFEQETGRGLERFFYDWTQRPAHPEIKVSFQWHEDEGLAEISIEQTQEASPFQFPVEIEFYLGDASQQTQHAPGQSAPGDSGGARLARDIAATPSRHVSIRRHMTDRHMRIFEPLGENPSMVLIDPGCAVLAEWDTDKGRDLWVAQLRSAPNVVARIRAAMHLGDSGGDQDITALADALLKETFWGVGVEIAGALGEAGGDAARDALLAGLGHEHPKVRRRCADELDSFYQDQKVADALRALIEKPDPSYSVVSASIESYGEMQPDGAVAFLTSLLDRDSHGERIRSAALRGIGEQEDDAGLETLLEWSKRGKPRNCRSAAMRAMANLVENASLDEDQTKRVVDSIVTALKGEQRRMRQAAVFTLRGLGEAARPAVAVLRALKANDPSGRVRNAAKGAIKRIMADAPVDDQIEDLRNELEELREGNEKLEERLEEIMAKQAGHATDAAPTP